MVSVATEEEVIEKEEKKMIQNLLKLDEVTAVSVNEDTMARFDSMMASIDYIVLLVILCAEYIVWSISVPLPTDI